MNESAGTVTPADTSPSPTQIDEAALRYAFHAAKWCSDGARGHTVAHDDEDEDGIRARLIAAYDAAVNGDVLINERGEELVDDD